MLLRPTSLGGALRLTAVVAALATVVPLLLDYSVASSAVPVAGPPADAPVGSLPADDVGRETSPGTWSLRAAGWYIQVDGVEVEAPALVQPAASRRRPISTAPVTPAGAHGPSLNPALSISSFDQLIAHHAKAEGFDWRLIAALIFEESRFNPTSESDKGAYGLMQVRPVAAHAVGADRFRLPNDNVSTGVRYLRHLDGKFREAGDRDRIGLVLAAYNMGPGHVRDAQMLARRFGFDPNRWEGHMDRILPLLELPSIYQRLPNGFAKGRDTVAYVQRTIARYHRYQRETRGVPTTDADASASSVDPLPANG